MATLRGWTSGKSIDGSDIVLDLTQIVGLAKNDVVFLFIANSGTAAQVTVYNPGWSSVFGQILIDNSNTRYLNPLWKAMGASPDTSVTILGSGGPGSSVDAYSAIAVAFSDCNVQSTPDLFAGTPSYSPISGVPDPPQITPSVQNALILVAAIGGFDTTVGTQAGYTQVGQIDTNSGTYSQTLAVAYQVLSGNAGVAQNPPPWSAWTASYYLAVTIPVKPTTIIATATGKTVGSPVIDAPTLTSGTIHYRSSAVASATANPASMTLSFAGMNLQPNDIVVLFIAAGINGAFDPAPSSPGWIDSGQGYKATTLPGTNIVGRCSYKRMGATPDTSVVITGDTSLCFSLVAYAIAFSGIATSNELAAATTVAVVAASGFPDAPAITPSKNGSLILVGACEALNAAPGTVAGYTSPSPAYVGTVYSSHPAQASPVYLILPDKAGAGVAQNPPAFAGGSSPSVSVTFTLAFAPASSPALVPGSFAVGSPQFAAPTLGISSNNFTAPDLIIVTPGFGVPSFSTLVRASSFAVASPVIGTSPFYPMMPVLRAPVSAVSPTPYTTKLFYGDLTHSFIGIGNPTGTKSGILWFESSGVLYWDIAAPPGGLTFHSGDYIEYGPTTTITSYIWGNVGGAWYYLRGATSTFYPWDAGPTPQPTDGPAIPGAANDLLIGPLQIDVALVAQPINGVAPSPLGQWLSPGDLSHSLVTPSGIWSIDAAGVVWFGNQAINPGGPYLGRYDVVQYAPTTNGETSNIWVTIAGAWLYFDATTAQFYTPNSGPFPQATNQPQWALTPPPLTVGSPSLPVLFMAPLSPNGVVLVGQSYTIVAADGTQAGLIGNEVYVNGTDTGFSVDGGVEIVNGLLYAWNASTNTWFRYQVGVWVAVTPPPARILATPALIVGSPVFDGQVMKQLHPMPALALTVDSPVFGSVFTSATPLGGAIWAPTGGALITGTGTLWNFGLSPPGDIHNKYVLRNGANPYGAQLPGYEIVTDTSGVVWVKAYNGQWYYDSGTAMVPWPAPPVMAIHATGFAVGSPAVGQPLPVVTWFNVYGFSVSSPQIDTPSFIGVTQMPIPLGIWIGPSSIGVAWPTAHEVNHLKATDLVPWFPDVGTSPLAVALAGNEIGTTDPIIRPLDQHTGSVLLYRSASGLEQAMADVDGFRLTATYAEIIKDQWDPNAISYANLPYLAYAMGVNLWEPNWSEAFRRYWVKNQWTLKQIRGSLYGITTYVAAVGGKVMSAIVPPAKFFPGKSYTAAERAAYVARFPQLRLYPYVARVQLAYICCSSKFISGVPPNETRTFNKNGCFTGPLWKFYPTAQDAGGRYTRTAVIYDPATGIETPLTYRTHTTVTLSGEVQTVAEITVPAKAPNTWFLGDPNRYPLPAGHPPRVAQNKHSIFLGSDLSVAARTIEIVVPTTSSIGYSKAIYQTISWGNEKLIDLYPDTINETHTFSKYGLTCGAPRGTGRIYLMGGSVGTSYLVRSVAWQFTYMVWYLFDPSRVPDYRKASVYMGHAQFGQHKYTAKIRIDVGEVWRPWYFSGTTFIRGHWHPPDNRRIEAVRRAVTAAMAERDTVGIDTAIKRVISTNDSLPCDGTFTVGEWIDARVI